MKMPRVYSGALPSRFVDRSALAAVAVLALVVRFHGITIPVIWYDEAFSVLLARHEPGQIWSLTARDVHPPLYYLVLHYWMVLFGDGAMAVRSLSALVDVGTVLLGVKLMSLVSTRRATWIAALLLALLPISVRYSQEARMYTLLGFWLMGATVALVCWVKESERKPFAFIYVLLMTAAFYTHYFAALCVLVHWFYWWWGRPGAASTVLPTRTWVLANVLIVVLFLPWLPHFIDHLTGRSGLGWIPPVTGQSVLGLVWQFIVMSAWGTQSLLLRMVPLGLVIACALVLIRKDNLRHRFNGLLVGYFFIPVVVLALLALIVPVFVPRYLVFSAVGVPFIVAVALDILGRRTGVLALAVVIVVTAEIQGLHSVYRQADGLNGTDLRRDFRLDVLAAEIQQMIRPGDDILLDSLIWYLPFSYYNQTGMRPTLYIHIPSGTALKGFDRNGYALISEDARWINFNSLQVLKCNEPRLWWIAAKTHPKDELLQEKGWEKKLTLVDREMVASLFILKASPASDEAGNPATTTPPLPPAAQNCPPAPSATSANKTPH
ncbi:glycosyltransferase family 39 protein [Pseudomonas sp. G2-4]|uniref:glycosyltransferase family 39 protein n=1 Tax=Pseudomonas sp. G2-4 TaxID=1506334 RepID=UPI0024BA25B8|nr:glycosyltransferase family 39 protein [Pseudomonas sp. G2-4]WHS59261.1 glycosyltransferase family 39 protein [Pseudomonas sp. G2-4]